MIIRDHLAQLKPLNGSSESGIRITYAYVIPLLSSAGIFGNMLSLFILNSNKNFRGFMYTYMKGLAITDTLYLISVLQVISRFQNKNNNNNNLDIFLFLSFKQRLDSNIDSKSCNNTYLNIIEILILL